MRRSIEYITRNELHSRCIDKKMNWSLFTNLRFSNDMQFFMALIEGYAMNMELIVVNVMH